MNAEYKGVFGKVKADAESNWKSLGENWAKNRIVNVRAQGGSTALLNSLEPGFKEWKGDAYNQWISSLASEPGVTGFKLRAVSELFLSSKKPLIEKALTEYLKGGLIVSADREAAVGKRQDFITYPTIINVAGVIKPTSQPPTPERPYIDVAGVQLVLLDPETHKEFLNKVYYVTPLLPATVQKMYNDIIADINKITASDYYCAFSVFGLESPFYPPPEIVSWLNECGAKLSAWQQYIGKTASGSGVVCYTFAGKKGLRIGAAEDFRIDTTRKINKLTSSAMYFMYGSGLRAKAKG
jgi:hypothetical protein